MEIVIPAVPLGVVTLLAFFSPYVVALINAPLWKTGSKRLVSIVVSLVLTAFVLWLYYLITGDTVPAWPVLLLLFFAVQQAAYRLVLKDSATKVEGRYGLRE